MMNRRTFHSALLLSAVTVCPSLLGQGNPAPRDFGNWLSSYGSTLSGYQANPGVPMIFPFTVLAGNDLISMYVDTDSHGYLASVIPTPGLTSSSVCGTTGVRCAADASLTSSRSAASGQGEQIFQPAVRPGAPQTRPPYRANATTSSHPPLPTFQLLPFSPVFPNQFTAPPAPVCDAIHDVPLVVVNHATASVSIYGSCSGTLIKKIPVTSNPLQAEITPDGTTAIVTNFDSAITFINLSTLTATTVQTSGIYNPSGISISPDGARAYITSLSSVGALLIVDIQKRQIIQTLTLTEYPQSVFLTPDGSQAWISYPLDGKIDVLDTLTTTIIKTLPLEFPAAVAFNSTGTLVFVALQIQGVVRVLNAATYEFVRDIQVGESPDEIGIAPDDSFMVVTNYDGQSVTVINLNGYSTITVALPDSPMGLSMRY